MPFERSPIDIFLGALNMVALPLVRGEDSEDMRETAQFYGFEDFGDHFKNVSPRVTELVVFPPSPSEPACVLTLTTPNFLLPGAFTRAAARWAKSQTMTREGPRRWRNTGLVFTLEISRSGGRTNLRCVLAPV
ncbi:MAG: hypothetical protein WDM79_15515 [Terricaulis sp.]